MENQVVFTNHETDNLYETLNISEERINFIQKKVRYFLLNSDGSISLSLEKIIEGLNPNETLFAVFSYSKEFHSNHLIGKVIESLENMPISAVVALTLTRAEIQHQEEIERDAKQYEAIIIALNEEKINE